MYADGDPIAELPVTVRVLPGAVRVIVPPMAAMTALGAKIVAARAVGELARRAGRGGGTSLPGKVLMRLEPHAIAELSPRLQRGSVLVSATNGKTTTAAMIASMLERAGISLVHNRAGANMAGGIASTLLAAARPGGRIDGELGLFEVDEFWLDRVTPELKPRAILLGNLFRDQLDRYGELETIADRWAAVVAALPAAAQLVLNADDPLIADLGREHAGVTYFGVEDQSVALPEMQHASDSKHCRRCGAAYVYDAIYLGHLGRYRCPSCGQERPVPDDRRRADRARRDAGGAVRAAHPGRHRHGAAAAPRPLQRLQRARRRRAVPRTGCLARAGRAPVWRPSPLRSAAPSRSRSASVELSILLIKNPAGANEILRTLALEHGELDLLAILNDRTADGHDVSWVWDADFEILASRVRHVTCAGTRAAELALRFKYAGVPSERLGVVRKPAGGARRGPGCGADAPTVRAADLHRAARAPRRARRPRTCRAVLAARGAGAVTAVIWHDLECGAYAEDLALWRSLAAERGGPVLDVGAGTGRVALDLATRGHRVTALDPDPELLAELARRARRARRSTRCRADARDFRSRAAVRRCA